MNDHNEVEILLVEDSEYDAELIMHSLKKGNLANKLIHVKDGEEALDFIFSRGKFSNRNNVMPNVVLLDINMPKVNGIEVLRQMKSDEASKMIPVIIMTSSKEEQDIITTYRLGVNSYVIKPVDFEGFAKAVSELGMYWTILNQPPLNESES